MPDAPVSIPFEVLVKSNKALLTKLFKEGLSPKSELLIHGFSDFFHETIDICSNKPRYEVADSFVSALIECLDSQNYRVVEVATKILRDYINSTSDIPPVLTPKLIKALNSNVPSSAYQIALTLGCIGCSKPDRFALKEIGVIAIHDIDPALCYNCMGGFGRLRNAELVIQALIDNLNRPISKDRKRRVRRACAIALGEIAYTNPEAAAKVLQALRIAIKDEAARDAIIFALGCIGYTRPDLIEDLIPKFQQVDASGYSEISMACHSALKKIGMETNCLVNHTTEENLEATIKIFCERMSQYNARMASESVFAFKDLAKKFPDRTVAILKDKLEQTNLGLLDEHICMALDIIAQELPELRKNIVSILIKNFGNGNTGYGVIESSSAALTRIFGENPELIPKDLENFLSSFLQYKQSGTITESVGFLLREISKNKVKD
jgi:HEAT repeat protein